MSQLELDIPEHEPTEIAAALKCLLDNLPRERWCTYCGIINATNPHESVDEIVRRSMKEAGIHKMRLEDIQKNLVKESCIKEDVVKQAIASSLEPVDETVKFELYREIVNAEIANDDRDYLGINEIADIVNPALPLSDKRALQALQNKQWSLSEDG